LRVAPRAHRHTISKLQFLDERPREDTPVTQFDIVFSQDSIEHFRDPGAVLAQMKRALVAYVVSVGAQDSEPRGRLH